MCLGLVFGFWPMTKWAPGKLFIPAVCGTPQHFSKRSALLRAATWLRTNSFNTAVEPCHADFTSVFASLEGKHRGALNMVLLMSFCPNKEHRSAQNTNSGSRFSPNRVGTRVLSSSVTEPGSSPIVNWPIRRRRYRRISKTDAVQFSTCCFSEGLFWSVAFVRKHSCLPDLDVQPQHRSKT